MARFLLLLLLAVYAPGSVSYRILMLPIHMHSHASCMGSIAVGLVDRGHEVHVLFGKDYKGVPSEFTSSSAITVERYERPDLDGAADIEEVNWNISRMVVEEKATDQEVLEKTSPLFATECRRLLLHNEPLMAKLESLKFDLAVVDGLFVVKCLYLVPHRLRIPFVTMTDAFEPWLARVPWLPSFVPNVIRPFTDKMTFSERLQNTFWTALIASVPIVPEPPEDILNRYREFGEFRALDEVVARSQLWILTSDFIIDYVKPLLPNILEAGGLTTRPPSGKLSADLKNFIEGSEKGVILVSFGSVVSNFPEDVEDKFISAFARLTDHRIIWRFENRNKKKLSGNVLPLSWVPQNDILAHPKTKLFVTHCGNNGQYEALYHGVPMIGFPLHGDQPYNGKRIVYKGFGLTLDIKDFTSDELLSKIRTVLSDTSFKTRIAKASAVYRSMPMMAREKSAWWIEHVIKFGGSHLQSSGNDLAVYQYLMLDVLAFLVVVVILFVGCSWKLLRVVCRKLRHGGNSTEKKRQ